MTENVGMIMEKKQDIKHGAWSTIPLITLVPDRGTQSQQLGYVPIS
jgi:hypothetical protein